MEEEKSLKLNLEHNPRFLSFMIMILSNALFIISIIIAVVLSPDIIGSSSLTFPKCSSTTLTNCIGNETNSIFILGISLKTYNQMLYLESDFKSSEDLHVELRYNLKMYYKKGNDEKLQTAKNKSLEINCKSGSCDSQVIFYIPYIKYDEYVAHIKVFDQISVDSLKFSIRFMTKEFTRFFLATKYFFLALSILALVFFFYSMFRVHFRHWPRQSKIIGLMLVSLFLFNEPLLYLSLNELSVGWSGVSVFCNSQFVAFLLMFWFLILHDDFSYNKWLFSVVVEASFVIVFFVLTCLMYMHTTNELKYDPTYSWNHQFPLWLKRVFIASVVVLVLLALWMIILVIYSIMTFRSRALRDKVLSCSVYSMIVASFLLIGLGAFQPLPRSGAVLLVSVSLFNLYFITLAWMFLPNRMAYLAFSLEMDARADMQRSPKNEGVLDNTILSNSRNLILDNKA